MLRAATALLIGSGVVLALLLGNRGSKVQVLARRVRRGLVLGDSMLASPVLTRELERLTGFSWDNYAVVGQNSERTRGEALRRLQPGVYGVLLVSTGANDGGGSPERTRANQQAIYNQAQATGTGVILLSEPPMRGYRRFPPAAVQRHDAVRAFAGGGVSDSYVDLYQLWGDRGGRLRAEYDAGDHLHPNVNGRQLLARQVAHVLGV